MEKRPESDWVAVEFYIGPQVLSGYLSISLGQRLLDLLNKIGDYDRDVQSDYIEFMTDISSSGEQLREIHYVRKAAVELAAISDPNLARGAGANVALGNYPHLEKLPVRVSLQMLGYVIDGNMHCAPRKTIRDVLDEKTLFLPLTDVTMIREKHLYGTRPFIAARKEQIISLKEESPG